MEILECKVMPYPWGSRTAIAELTGRAATETPEAEMWMGAHPIAPSMVQGESLEAIIARDPSAALGGRVVRELGPRLPFLLKVLAAAEPLSLQAHPTAAQAKTGFDDEERRGISRTAAHRNYKDTSHKPELLCALTPFVALSGFRAVDETLRLFDALAVPALVPLLEPLRATMGAQGLHETFRRLMTLEDPGALVEATLRACKRPATEFAAERRWAVRLAELYPGDIGVVSALLLQLVELAPGDAIYLGAGNLHAYLEGTGIEIMASSDNVLRGGLTKKHVDVPELLQVLDFTADKPGVVAPRRIGDDEVVYDTPAREFRLSRIDVRGEATREVYGPEILLVADGSFATENGALSRGAAAFVTAASRRWSVRGHGTLFRATTNLS